MPQVITLPGRKGAYTLPQDQIDEMAALIPQLRGGQAVAMDAEGFETEGKALSRGRKMQTAMLTLGHHVKVHSIQDDDTKQWYPAISLNITATNKARKAAKDAAVAVTVNGAGDTVEAPQAPATPAKKSK